MKVKGIRAIFTEIASLGRTLSEALDRAQADGSEYGANGVEVERRRATGVWKRAAVQYLESFKTEIEALRDKVAADSRGLLEAIRSGRGPGSSRPVLVDTMHMSEEQRASIKVATDAAASMATISRQMEFANTLAVRQLEDTRTLWERLTVYLNDAEHGNSFDYETFAVDGRVIPLILRSRADGGDGRAKQVVEMNLVGRIETALLRRGGQELCDNQDVQLFEQVRAAVENLDPPTLRGLQDVQEILALVQRLVGLKVETIAPRELPAPRSPMAKTNTDWPAGMPAA